MARTESEVLVPARNDPDNTKTRPSLFPRLNEETTRESSWQEFVDRYASIIGRYARHSGAPPEREADVIQEVLMSFFKRSSTFKYDPSKGFRAYLWKVTQRTVWRSNREARVPGGSSQELREADGQVDAVWRDIWEEELLRKAIERVCIRYKNNRTFRAFKMVVLEGLAVEEAATALDLSVDNARKAKDRITVAVGEEYKFLRLDLG